MQVILQLPEHLAGLLGVSAEGLSRAALEALVLEGLRAEKLTVAQGRELLGIASRDEMDGFLKAHGVLLATTVSDVLRDADTALAFRAE